MRIAERAAVKVRVGTSCLTRDLVWCQCGRGLSLSGKWIYCPTCGAQIDQDSYFSAIEQARINGPSFLYKDPEAVEDMMRTLDRIRAAIVVVFGGMGNGSAIWGQGQWEKGWTAGVQAALLAFDTELKK